MYLGRTGRGRSDQCVPAITATKKFSRNSDMVTGFFASVNQPDFRVQRKSRCKIGAIQAGIANAVSGSFEGSAAQIQADILQFTIVQPPRFRTINVEVTKQAIEVSMLQGFHDASEIRLSIFLIAVADPFLRAGRVDKAEFVVTATVN